MPQTRRPEQIIFRGIYLAGNPVRRPAFTCGVIQNLRIMPGYWVRLRSGRKAKYNSNGGTIMQIVPFRDPNTPGSSTHLAQIKYAGAGTVNWTWFDISTYAIDPFGVQAITLSNDSSYSLTNQAAACNVTDRPVFYNGLGVRNGTNSRPPFSSLYGGVVRYFGLDAYCPSGSRPTVSFAAGAGNNTVASRVTIYVGIYHEPTGHYSNVVEAGTITATGATGTITVSNLQRLIIAYNNATEQNELKYVFWATVDGFGVPYLINNSAHTGPYTASSAATSASLSIETAGIGTENGYFLDTTSERPVDNFPPRPMKCIAAVNQRVYGIPLSGGSGSGADFGYTWQTRDMASIVWSKAPGDDRKTKQIGDPSQCWPLANKKATPDIEVPLWCEASVNGSALLVWSQKSTFLMSELSTGLHVYEDISRIHGLGKANTVRNSKYGKLWVDQRNEICLLSSDSMAGLSVISSKYSELMRGKTVSCADYILDPAEGIDRYEVWFTDGTGVCHDFALRDEDFPEGMAYTTTGQDYTAAATLVAADGTRHFVVAKGGFYTHETEPTTGRIPTTDDTFSNTTDQTFTTAEVTGEIRFNWNRVSDWTEFKKAAGFFLIGDGKVSTQLGASPITAKWWGDFEQVPGTPNVVIPASNPKTRTDWSYYFAPIAATRAFFKIGFTLAGHSTDDSDFTYHRRPSEEGDLDKNFYGSIMEAAFLFSDGGDRL